MKRVFICSPYRGDVRANRALAQAVCRAVLLAGDAPFAPHLLYPGVLDDADSGERALGIGAGLSWLAVSDEVLVVGEPSEGMRQEIAAAETLGVPVRRLPEPAPVVSPPPASPTLRVPDVLRRAWEDRVVLLALLAVVLGFLLLPGCAAPACWGGSPAPASR